MSSGTCPLLVPPRLRLEQLGIAGVGPHELRMAPGRTNRAVFQEQNPISLTGRRKAVRDEQYRRPSGLPVQPVQQLAEKALLAPRVEGGRRLIEDEQEGGGP